MKTTLLWGLMCLVFIVVLTCSSVVSVAHAQQDKWRQFEGTTLTVLTLQMPYSEGLKALLPEFEKLTGMNVELETMGQLAVIQKIGIELAAHSSAYDLVFTEADRIALYSKNGWVEPLDAYIENASLTNADYLAFDDIIPSTVDAFRNDGKLYGLPYFAATVMMYYQKDVFEKYGISAPPETFEELLEVAKKIHTKDIPAIALRGQPGAVMNVWHWGMFLYGMGGNFFKHFPDDMTPILDQPEAVKALEIYAELMQNYSIPGAASATYDDVVLAIQQGKVGMVLEGAPLGGRILDPEKSKVVGNLGFHLVPGGPAGRFPPFTSQGLIINSASRNKEAAYLFLQWATSRQTLLKIAVDGRYVAVCRKSIWTDPAFEKKYGFDYGAGSYLQTFQKTLEVAPFWYRPAFDKWPEIGDRVGIAIQEAIVKKKTAQEALTDANNDIKAILKKGGYLQ